MAGDPGLPPELQSALAGLGNGGQAPASGPTAANALGGNFLAGGKAPLVYWGSTVHTANRAQNLQAQYDGLGAQPMKRVNDVTKTLPEAVGDFYTWDDSQRGAFAQKLYRLGLIDDPNNLTGPNGVLSAWQDAVQQASNYYSIAGKPITPWQMIDIMGNLSHGGIQPKTQTSTSTSINVPTVEDAHAATRSIFQSLLGRDPGSDELDRYASMITSFAQKHPSVTKTTQTTDAHGNSTSSSTKTGSDAGISSAGLQDMLAQHAKADPEYGAYQASTAYYNALVSAIGGTGA